MRTSRPSLSRRHEPRFRPLQRASSTNRFMMMECEEYLPRSSAGRKIGFAEVEVEQREAFSTFRAGSRRVNTSDIDLSPPGRAFRLIRL